MHARFGPTSAVPQRRGKVDRSRFTRPHGRRAERIVGRVIEKSSAVERAVGASDDDRVWGREGACAHEVRRAAPRGDRSRAARGTTGANDQVPYLARTLRGCWGLAERSHPKWNEQAKKCSGICLQVCLQEIHFLLFCVQAAVDT